MDERFKSTTAFVDLLFLIILGFATLFVLAFLMINPPKQEAKITPKAEFLIVLDWDKKSNDDLDLYVRDPIGNLVYFSSKENGFLHLDKDDLGRRNDTIVLSTGAKVTVDLNREVISIRGILPGEYTVNVHLYTKTKKDTEIPGYVEVIKIKPYAVVSKTPFVFDTPGQEETILRFSLDAKGVVTDINKDQERFITNKDPEDLGN